MLKALSRHGLVPDLVVGASVGAINGVYFAMAPTRNGISSLERIWSRLSRQRIFPFSPISSLLGFLGKQDHVVAPSGLQSLLESELGEHHLEYARVPCHVVATDVLTGSEVVISSGRAVPALMASAAIPGIFPPAFLNGRYQLVSDIERFRSTVKLVIVPPLCPMAISPYDFSQAKEMIWRADATTRLWLKNGGLTAGGWSPGLIVHHHKSHVGTPLPLAAH